jgi:monofunctional biosynthetic peptidoglycan transglycosylase
MPRLLHWLWRLPLIAIGISLLLVLSLRLVPPPVTAFMLESDRKPVRYEWVGWQQIAPVAALAVVASEDQKFPTHHGFDFEAIGAAMEHNERGRHPRGASTISQQTAKNLFLWPGKSYVRKGLEAYFTVLLETFWTKRRILEVYLNIAQFGPDVYGVGAASRAYFGKPPTRLAAHEAALLAAVLPNPERLHVERPSAFVQERAADIEEQMRQLGNGYLAGL